MSEDDRAVVERQIGRPPRAFLRVVGPLSVRAPGRDRAVAVRRGRRAVPDHVLPHVPASRRRRFATGGGGRGRALVDGGCGTRPETAGEPRRGDGAAARSSGRSSRASVTGSDGGASLELGIGGASRPERLKCLHAHVAFALAQPGYVLGERIARRARALWPGACCSRDRRTASIARVEGSVELARQHWAGRLPPARPDEGARADALRAAARAGRDRDRRAPPPDRQVVHARRARRCVRRADRWAYDGGRGACGTARDWLSRRARRPTPPSTSTRGARGTIVRDGGPGQLAGGRARRRRRRAMPWRPLIAVVVLLCVFAAGVALGEALHDNPKPGGTTTTPADAPPAAAGAADRDGHGRRLGLTNPWVERRDRSRPPARALGGRAPRVLARPGLRVGLEPRRLRLDLPRDRARRRRGARRPQVLLLTLVAAVVADLLSRGLKAAIDRERPHLPPGEPRRLVALPTDPSFPSATRRSPSRAP